MWINPYLYYWYYRDEAIAGTSGVTRGEEIVTLTDALLTRLRSLDIERQTAEALRAYSTYERARVSTYMKEAHGADPEDPSTAGGDEADDPTTSTDELFPAHGEGYAGVALDIIEAMECDRPQHTAVNVPNDGAIAGLRDEDVVEVSVLVERGSVRPVAIGEMPEHQELLVRTVKLYERTAVDAILERSRPSARRALLLHPLVGTYPLAGSLVDAYLAAHARYAGDWGNWSAPSSRS
jgi:6-phospho-beta-glucosidase